MSDGAPTTAPAEGLPTLVNEGGVATIQLNRPSVHNRMEPEDLVEMNRLLSAAEADPAVRVLVLTGDRASSFSSGFNIGKLNGRRRRRWRRWIVRTHGGPDGTVRACRPSAR